MFSFQIFFFLRKNISGRWIKELFFHIFDTIVWHALVKLKIYGIWSVNRRNMLEEREKKLNKQVNKI